MIWLKANRWWSSGCPVVQNYFLYFYKVKPNQNKTEQNKTGYKRPKACLYIVDLSSIVLSACVALQYEFNKVYFNYYYSTAPQSLLVFPIFWSSLSVPSNLVQIKAKIMPTRLLSRRMLRHLVDAHFFKENCLIFHVLFIWAGPLAYFGHRLLKYPG